MTKKKIGISLVFLLLILSYGRYWIGCHLDSAFLFSKLDLNLRIIFDIRTDTGVPLMLSHILHNKVTQGSVDIVNAYLHFFDIRFLFFSLSPLGIAGLLLWTYYVIRKKLTLRVYEKMLIVLILCLPLCIIFIPMRAIPIALLSYYVCLLVLSFRGLLFFISHSKHAIWYVAILGILTISYVPFLGSFLVEVCH